MDRSDKDTVPPLPSHFFLLYSRESRLEIYLSIVGMRMRLRLRRTGMGFDMSNQALWHLGTTEHTSLGHLYPEEMWKQLLQEQRSGIQPPHPCGFGCISPTRRFLPFWTSSNIDTVYMYISTFQAYYLLLGSW